MQETGPDKVKVDVEVEVEGPRPGFLLLWIVL